MGTAVISKRRMFELAGPDGGGYGEVIYISSIGAGSPSAVSTSLSVVEGAMVNINKSTGTAPKVSYGGVAATGTFTAAMNASDNDTATLGTLSSAGAGTSKVYRFKSTIAAINDVLIGASASDTLDNFIAAVNQAAGAGTLYFTGTIAHPDISAAAGAGDTVTLTARGVGAKYNQLATTETGAQLSFGATTLTGGVNAGTVSIGFTSAADDNAPMTLVVFGMK